MGIAVVNRSCLRRQAARAVLLLPRLRREGEFSLLEIHGDASVVRDVAGDELAGERGFEGALGGSASAAGGVRGAMEEWTSILDRMNWLNCVLSCPVRARDAGYLRPALEITLQTRDTCGVTKTVRLDASNRIVLSRELRQAAGIPPGQQLIASATPGRIVLELVPAASGKVVRRRGLKVWTGDVPAIPIAEAVDAARNYAR